MKINQKRRSADFDKRYQKEMKEQIPIQYHIYRSKNEMEKFEERFGQSNALVSLGEGECKWSEYFEVR